MMAGKVVGLEFEIISKLDSYFLMTVKRHSNQEWHSIAADTVDKLKISNLNRSDSIFG